LLHQQMPVTIFLVRNVAFGVEYVSNVSMLMSILPRNLRKPRLPLLYYAVGIFQFVKSFHLPPLDLTVCLGLHVHIRAGFL
jgi:hypothetical protein